MKNIKLLISWLNDEIEAKRLKSIHVALNQSMITRQVF